MCVEGVSTIAASKTETTVGMITDQPHSAANSSGLERVEIPIAHAVGIGISKACGRGRPVSVIRCHEWRRRSRARHERAHGRRSAFTAAVFVLGGVWRASTRRCSRNGGLVVGAVGSGRLFSSVVGLRRGGPLPSTRGGELG
jgi:hypothetical protein